MLTSVETKNALGDKPRLSDFEAARKRLREIVLPTPLVPSPQMSDRVGREVQLKLESMLPIGAFKLRGAANAILGLPADVPGVICCSTGNHGRGVAYAAARCGLKAVVCMSSLVPQAKIDGIRALGAEIRIVGASQDDAQVEVDRLVASAGYVEVPPFDHAEVIAGQGTIGLEIVEQCPEVATILVPLSGGGLAAGIAAAAKALRPSVRVVGISMDRGAAMYESLAAGHPVEVTEVASLADSLGGGIGLDNRLTFAMCRDLLDEVLTVTEDEIYRAMQRLFFEERMVTEGAAAVGVAALTSGRLNLPPGPVVTIISGRNVDMTTFLDVVSGRDIRLGDLVVKGQAHGA